MATGGLYGQSSAGIVSPQSGSESNGLYGNNTVFAGTYFEWFIFQVSDTQPATPTGGSWSFTTNSGTPPTGWLATPPTNPTNTVWVSVGLVNSKSSAPIVWSTPGKFSFASGLPILSGSSAPLSGDGQSDQLYIQTGTTPETIWFKQAGTWTRLTGSTLYVDLTSNQTIAGTKTFASQIQGSISGNAANVTGVVDITHGGTGSTTASAALTALGAIGSITSTDGSIVVVPSGTSVDLAVSQASPASTLLTPVRNTTGATLTKGTVVYISGATGQIATVSKALATSDATSAQTLGMLTTDLANNSNGYVTVFGLLVEIDTSAYTDGAQLYLSGTTAGAVTATKPSAPTHLVYVGVVEYAHAIHGKILVKVQNGYELEELHNVAISSPTTGQTITYNSSTSLWSNSAVSLTSGVTGTLPIANGGTGQTTAASAITALTGTQTNAYYLRSNGTNASLSALSAADLTGTVSIATGGTGANTANAAFNALAPSQTGNSGKYLTTDGTNTSWATNPLGTVTSVGGTGTVSGITLSGTVTTSGNLTLGGSLDLSAPPAIGATTPNTGAFTTLSASGAVTLSGGTANGVPYLNGSKVLTSGSALTFDGTNLYNSGRTGLGVANTSGPTLKIDKLSGSDQLSFYESGVDLWHVYTSASGLGFYYNPGASEIMRLTSTGLGIGTSSPLSKLTVNGTISSGSAITSAALFYQSGTNLFIENTDDTGTAGNSQIRFRVRTYGSPITAATIDASGNLGLGTSSPGTYRLYVEQSGTSVAQGIAVGASTDDSMLRVFHTGSIAGLAPSYDTTGSYVPLVFYSGGQERVRIDTSGNLGLGVTPSAWGSNFKALQISTTASFGATTSDARIGNNLYYDGAAYKRITAAAANYFLLNSDSSYSWLQAGSSTAGSNISWTTAMTLDASGNLGLGPTSPGYRLDVNRGSNGFNARFGNGTNYLYTYSDGSGNYLTSDTSFNTSIFMSPTSSGVMTFLTAATERARIYSDGNMALGYSGTSINGFTVANYSYTTAYAADLGANAPDFGYGSSLNVWAPSDSATISGITLETRSTGRSRWDILNVWTGSYLGDLVFRYRSGGTSTAEAMRINSSGNLLIGQTSAGAVNLNSLSLYGSGGGIVGVNHASGSASGNNYAFFAYNGSSIGSITQNGTTGVLYNITSDYRLKEVIGAVSGSGERIDALQPIDYTMKADGSVHRGFLAHKFQEVYANSVTGTKDAVDEEGNPVYQQMQASTPEVIADLVAEIQSLRKRLAALEAK